MKNLFLITLTILFVFEAFSQDILLKRSGDQLEVKVTEIADDYIKYKKKGSENGPDYKISVSDIFMLTLQDGEKIMFNESNKKTKNNFSMLLAGTRIPLSMNETISSDKKGGRKVSTGEVITLTVHLDVSDIDGNILIKQGSQAIGTITQSVNRKAAGTKGKLSFNVNNVRAVDNQSIPITFSYDFAGASKTAIAATAAAVVALPLLLVKGKPAIVRKGTIFEALVDTDRKINLSK